MKVTVLLLFLSLSPFAFTGQSICEKGFSEKKNYQGADLRGVEWQEANLKGAKLQFADLRGANLFGAKLQGANLEGAKLHGAQLQEANLQVANIKGAAFEDADLTGAKVTAEQAKYLTKQGYTGFVVKEYWLKEKSHRLKEKVTDS